MARKAYRKKAGPPARSSSAREGKRDVPLVRLNKLLADHGIASRRACDELIVKGKVTVDGMPVTELGSKVDPRKQMVEVDGVHLRPAGATRRYYLLHKPPGVVCTSERRETRPRAIDLITDRAKGRIYTVGRLDEESTGLILLTNDGEFAQRVSHPRYGVSKTYRVKVAGRIPDEVLQKVREGVHLAEGKTTGARILVKRRSPKVSVLAVTLREGRNREVRRVFARVGYRVLSLMRTDIGSLNVRGLREGHWRALSRGEVEELLGQADGGLDRPAATRRGGGATRRRGGVTRRGGSAAPRGGSVARRGGGPARGRTRGGTRGGPRGRRSGGAGRR